MCLSSPFWSALPAVTRWTLSRPRSQETSPMRFILFIAAAVATWVPHQEPPVAGPLPMRYIEVCQIDFTGPLIEHAARFAGSIDYDATVDLHGAIASLTFSEPATPQANNMRRFLRLDLFEACVKRWSFGAAGKYRLRLEGGTLSPTWVITASQGGKSIRLMVPKGP